VKYAKVGMHIQTLKGSRYVHLRVSDVTDQDTVEVDDDGTPVVVTRLSEPPNWAVNRFAEGD